MKQSSISIAPVQGGYVPFWGGAELNAPAAQISTIRTVEVRQYILEAAYFSPRHFRVLIEGPEGSFGWDVVPHPTRGAECALAVSGPDWGEFFDSLRIGPIVFYELNENELERSSRSFPAAVRIPIPGDICMYPQPENIWAVDDDVAIIHVGVPSSAWHRDEAIDVEPGLYRAQRIRGGVLKE